MGFFSKKPKSIISDYFMLEENLGKFNAGDAVEVAVYEEEITITAPLMKSEIKLSLSKITDVFYGIVTEEVAKNKSPIGRAVAGGVLFGGVGAVVGAVSGVGSKTKKEYHTMFIISYTSSDGKEAFLKFEDTRHYRGEKVAKKLKELTGISEDATIIL